MVWAGAACGCGAEGRVSTAPDGAEVCVGGGGARGDHLEAVIRWVVLAGDHDPGPSQCGGGEVDLFGAAQAEVVYGGSLVSRPCSKAASRAGALSRMSSDDGEPGRELQGDGTARRKAKSRRSGGPCRDVVGLEGEFVMRLFQWHGKAADNPPVKCRHARA